MGVWLWGGLTHDQDSICEILAHSPGAMWFRRDCAEALPPGKNILWRKCLHFITQEGISTKYQFRCIVLSWNTNHSTQQWESGLGRNANSSLLLTLRKTHTKQESRGVYKCQMYTKQEREKGKLVNRLAQLLPVSDGPRLCDEQHSQQVFLILILAWFFH